MTRDHLTAREIGSAPPDTEEWRGYFQSRLCLFATFGATLSALFLVVGNLLLLGQADRFELTAANNLWHLGGTIFLGACALFLRRVGVPAKALAVVDVAVTLVPLAAFAAMAAQIPGPRGGRADLAFMLITVLTLMARATVIPSTAGQTAVVGAVGSVPAILLGYFGPVDQVAREHAFMGFTQAAFLSLWTVAAVATSALASRIIYGLRAKADAAQKLGQYELAEKIGEGGMGVVYRARHAMLRRPTAIKLLPPDRAGAKMLARFEREVQLTAQLTHPNTVAIFDFGRTPDGIFYYAMEFLDGVDLQRLVDDGGPLPPARVVHVLVQAASALVEAHAVGLVHRDIKPANMILCQRGGVPDVLKVLDFGLVKQLGAQDGEAPGLTSETLIVGTPLYMAPESIVSGEADARSDVYAIGAVGYFLLTGKPVFGGKMVEVCAGHLHQAPEPPSRRVPGPVPERLERLLLRCLAKSPDDRPQSARELRAELLACGAGEWSEEDAAAWWRDRGGRRGEAAPGAGATA